MERQINSTRRPEDTAGLLSRLKQSDDPVSEREKKGALEPLLHAMVENFKNGDPKDLSEAVQISSVVDSANLEDLVAVIANMVIKGTSDNTLLNTRVLPAIPRVLKIARDTKGATRVLEHMMGALQERLTKAIQQANLIDQYDLLSLLSMILDGMVDHKVSGIARMALHEPLLKELGKLGKADELRVSHAANYAYQALLGVPNDESRFQKAMRITLSMIKPATELAGAVGSMDPSKIIKVIEESTDDLERIPDLIEKVGDVVDKIKDLYETKEFREISRKQSSWYANLRYAKTLIQSGAPRMLQILVGNTNVIRNENFVCGLLASLEEACLAGPKGEEIARALEQCFNPPKREFKKSRMITGWYNMVADTLKWDQWQSSPDHGCLHFLRLKKKDHKRTLDVFHEGNDSAVDSYLFKKSWKACTEAHRFYADAAIRNYYSRGDLLKIERITGNALNMEHYFINIVMTQQGDKKTKKAETSPFSLSRRLQVSREENNTYEFTLPTLFKMQTLSNGTLGNPKRVLIRGRAGVGKTTLCKKIVHDFVYKGLWTDTFDRLIWIQLRSLKLKFEERSSSSYSLEQLLHDLFFTRDTEEDRNCFSQALKKVIDDDDRKKRNLFILDGLDEISSILGSSGVNQPAFGTFLWDLLNQEYAIVTSRSSVVGVSTLHKFDFELETVGFKANEVELYVQHVCPEEAESIMTFIRGHYLVQSVLRIPVQLDAFCSTWSSDMRPENPPQTMADFYKAVALKLWKKDLLKRSKMSENMIKDLTPLQVSNREDIQDWSSLLEALAFTGMCNDAVEFDHSHRVQVMDCWVHQRQKEGKKATITSKELLELSFLRTSDGSAGIEHSVFHFLHLTYQEYFAALYFVGCWEKRDLVWVDFEVRKECHKDTLQFLWESKYDPRYNILWRFVVGILYQEGQNDQLCSLLRNIESEPRDLLHVAHFRLLRDCYNEVAQSTEFNCIREMQRDFEVTVMYWLKNFSFPDRRLLTSFLSDMEFPERLLSDLISENYISMGHYAIIAIQRRPFVSQNLLQIVAALARKDQRYSGEVIKALVCHSCWTDVLDIYRLMMRSSSPYVRIETVRSIHNRSSVPEELLGDLLLSLDDEDTEVKRVVVNLLSGQRELPLDIQDKLRSWIKREGLQAGLEHVRLHTSHVSAEICSTLLDEDVKELRVFALQQLCHFFWQEGITWSAVTKMVRLLGDDEEAVRGAAACALRSYSEQWWPLSSDFVSRLESFLKEPDLTNYAKSYVALILTKRAAPHDAACAILRGTIKGKDELKLLSLLPPDSWWQGAIEDVLKRLDSTHPLELRREAAKLLIEKEVDLSETDIQYLSARLDDDDEELQASIIKIFLKQKSLAEPNLEQILSRLESKRRDQIRNIHWWRMPSSSGAVINFLDKMVGTSEWKYIVGRIISSK